MIRSSVPRPITWLAFYPVCSGKEIKRWKKAVVADQNDPFPCFNSQVSTHAEIAAIRRHARRQRRDIGRNRKVRRGTSHLDLVVIRLSKRGLLGNSRPCAGCARTLQKMTKRGLFQLHNVHYSNEQGEMTTARFCDLVSQTTFSRGSRECSCLR